MVAPRNIQCDQNIETISEEHSQSGSESDSEVALDLKRRKHVADDAITHGVYWLNVKKSSSHTVFPMPGKDAADTLRLFLQNRLSADLVRDEYGTVKPITEIKDDWLPSLQTQLRHVGATGFATRPVYPVADKRRERPLFNADIASISTTTGIADRVPRSLALSNHATLVAGLLDANHIFIVRDGGWGACELRACQPLSNDRITHSTIITIEPLIHWGTVTAITDTLVCGGRIQAFCRDGEKSTDPLWTLAVKRFTPEHPATYCAGCLELIMDNPSTFQVAVEQHERPTSTVVNAHAAHLMDTKIHFADKPRDNFDMVKTSLKRILSDSRDDIVDGSQASVNTFKDRDCMASLHLDGAQNAPDGSENDVSHGSNNVENKQGVVSHNATPYAQSADSEHFNASTKYPGNKSAISRKSPEPSSRSTHPAISSTNLQSSAPAKQSPATIKSKRPKTVTSSKTLDQLSTSVVDPTPSRGTKRKFGQELDANSVIKPPKKTSIAPPKMKLSKQDATGTSDIRNFFLKPTADKEAMAPATRSANSKPIDVERPELEGEQSTSSSPPSDATIALDKSYVPDQQPRGRSSARKTKTKSTNTTPTPKPSTSPPFAPILAKRAPTPAPSGVSDYAWHPHQVRIPSATEIICSCSKAARTPDVKIVQCSNTDCVVGWYHYDCLDKSAKLSCRHRTLVCSHCRIDAQSREADARNGWSVEKMVEGECRLVFGGREMVAAMPVLGGGYGVVDPYGLDTLGVAPASTPAAVAKSSPGALGSLNLFGYAASAPFMLNYAYVHGTAHLHLSPPKKVSTEEMYGEYEEEEYYDEEEEEGDEVVGEDEDMEIEVEEDWEDIADGAEDMEE